MEKNQYNCFYCTHMSVIKHKIINSFVCNEANSILLKIILSVVIYYIIMALTWEDKEVRFDIPFS